MDFCDSYIFELSMMWKRKLWRENFIFFNKLEARNRNSKNEIQLKNLPMDFRDLYIFELGRLWSKKLWQGNCTYVYTYIYYSVNRLKTPQCCCEHDMAHSLVNLLRPLLLFRKSWPAVNDNYDFSERDFSNSDEGNKICFLRCGVIVRQHIS